MAGAYIHIPFCDHICYYCDFNKVFIEGQPVDQYVDMLLQEMRLVMAEYANETVQTVYIGGGTPTSLSPQQLARLLAGIREILPFEEGEFTVEANPNDLLTTDKLEVMRAYGVNRLSMGVQSFDDAILKKIGRTHRVKDVYQAIANARRVGFDNISIDLMFRLPDQTREGFLDTLEAALALDLPHYAIYALILERKTVFYNLMRQGRLPLPDQDVEADMYQDAIDLMQTHGRAQYEISNFAKPGYRSQHNLLYWQNDKYFGFGAGAYGYLGKDRYHNFGPIQQYLSPLEADHRPVLAHHLVPLSEQIEEEMFLGLRTLVGVNEATFEQRYGRTIDEVYGTTVTDLVTKGLLARDNGHIHLTQRGLFMGNDVFAHFLIDDPLI